MFDWQPVWLSVKIAIMALAGVGISGILVAFWLTRVDFKGKNFIETILTLPLVLPPIVSGFILLVLIGRQGPVGWFVNQQFGWQLIFTPFAALLAAMLVSFPLMFQSAKAALLGVDRRLEDVARTLGAGNLKVFFTITLPLAWPGLVTGMVLSFSRALGEFGATAMVAGNIPGKTQTIPVAIYFASESGDLSTAGMYVLLISGLTFGLIFIANHWSAQKTARYQRRQNSVNSGVTQTITRISTSGAIRDSQ